MTAATQISRQSGAARRGVLADVSRFGVLGHLDAWWCGRRLVGRVGGLAVAVVAGLALGPTSAADGAQAHAYAPPTFAGQGSGAGELELEGGNLAVDDETGNVYVADVGNDRVDEFTAKGVFVRAWGWAVADGSTAALQECAGTCFKGLSGSGAGEFQAPMFIAVDNSCALHTSGPEREPDPLVGSACEIYDPSNDDVYVGEGPSVGIPLVTKFTATGALVSSWGDRKPANGQLTGKSAGRGPFLELQGIAVDATGSLWVWSSGISERYMFEFTPGGTAEPTTIQESFAPSAIGIAKTSQDDSYVSSGTEIVKLTSAGARLGVVAQGTRYETTGGIFERDFASLAVDPTHDFLYLDEGHEGDSVRVFSPQCVPVVEPFAEYMKLCQPTEVLGGAESLGSSPVLGGVTVNSSTGMVFVSNRDQIVRFPATLEAVVGRAAGVGYSSAVVDGEVSPENGAITACSVQFGESLLYGGSVPCVSAAAGHEGEPVGTPGNPITEPVRVLGDLSALAGGSVVHYRVRVARAGGGAEEGGVLYSEDGSFVTLSAPVVSGVSVPVVGGASAMLQASIDPEGVETTYRFEYDTRGYEKNEAPHGTVVPVPDGSVGGGSAPVVVDQEVTGLQAGATYYWRVVATSHCNPEVPAEVCVSETPVQTFVYLSEGEVRQPCPNEASRAENLSSRLADCRAYEMVTPARKNGALFGDVFGRPETGVSVDGSRVTSIAIQCPVGALSCIGDRDTQGSPFVFERGEQGWQSTALLPSSSELAAVSRWGTLPESGQAILVGVATPGTPEDLFVGRPGAYTEVGPVEEQPRAHTFEGVIGITPDATHILFESAFPVWAFDATSPEVSHRLYEYVGAGRSEPMLVGVTGGEGSRELVSRCGTSAGSDGEGGRLSVDGRSVFFVAIGKRGCFGSGPANEHVEVPADELFDRVEGETAGAHTVAISKPSPSECGAGGAASEVACRRAEGEPGNAEFQGASEDASVVYFTDTQQLTDEASEDDATGDIALQEGCVATQAANGCNLYMYDFGLPTGGRLVDVSAGDTSGSGPEVQGVMAVSADGSHVYFVARGVLTEAANVDGEKPREGGENLYVYERGAAHPKGRLAFVATISGNKQWVRGPRSYEANVTPDGGFLVFEASNNLTVGSSGSGVQLYRYNAVSGVLQRVSVGERGFGDNGNAGGASETAEHYGGAPPTAAVRMDMSMSNSGALVFFASSALLAPGASVEGANIYEWKEDGVDGCGVVEGCVALIAAGAEELLGVDGSGETVFFATSRPMIASDVDTESDFYDARVDGGFPQSKQEVVCGEGVECHPSPPVEQAPVVGSFEFSGTGNPLFFPPPGGGPPKPTAEQIRQRERAAALKVCRRERVKRRRVSCERRARKRYGRLEKATKASKPASGAKRDGSSAGEHFGGKRRVGGRRRVGP